MRGTKAPMFVVSHEDVLDGTIGICISCGEHAFGVEPDAMGYRCESCGCSRVMGLEQAVMLGFAIVDFQ